MRHIKIFIISALFAIAILGMAHTQEMQTAEQLFGKVSDRYASINDYQGQVVIASAKQSMSGSILFKAPSLLRVDFTQPSEQAIVFNGSRLVIYLPQYRAVLSQDTGDAKATGAGLASREGLKMMKRSYTIAWESSPEAIPLDSGTGDLVYRLSLNRKNVSDGFKTIRLSISQETKLIRRLEGWTIAGERIAFTFSDIQTNVGVSANRFMFDTPPTASVYNNFLFKTEN